MSNSIKLTFFRKKRPSQSCAKDKKKNIGEIKSSATCDKELTEKNISIITDKYLELDTVDNVCLQQQHVNARISISSNMSTEDTYVIIACEEKPSLNNTNTNTNWQLVNYHDITNTMRRNSIIKKYCSPKFSFAWLRNIRGIISKCHNNKINPVPTSG